MRSRSPSDCAVRQVPAIASCLVCLFQLLTLTDLNVDDGVGGQTEHFQTVQMRDVLDVADLVRAEEQSVI